MGFCPILLLVHHDSPQMRFTPTDSDRAVPAPSDAPEAPRRSGPLFFLDAGWLFLIAGAAVVVATVLIPAVDDLAEARWHRDRALALEKFRSDRLRNYSDYLDALDRHEKTLMLSLAATQLNLAPSDLRPLYLNPEPLADDASVFGRLEPTLNLPRPPQPPSSWLQRLATGDSTRVWMISGGMLCMLIGLLPPSQSSASTTGRIVGLARRRQPDDTAAGTQTDVSVAGTAPAVTAPGTGIAAPTPAPAPRMAPVARSGSTSTRR